MFILSFLCVHENNIYMYNIRLTEKFQKEAPPCISPSKYKPPKPIMQKTLC